MRAGIAYFIMILLLASCASPSGNDDGTDRQWMEGVDTTPVPDMHTSEIALDYHGLYSGILPCADCEGIEATIELFDDGTFSKRLYYIGKGDDAVVYSGGLFSWEDGGGVIRLDGDHGFTRYMVAENFLVHLEDEYGRYRGDLGEHYVLQKQHD